MAIMISLLRSFASRSTADSKPYIRPILPFVKLSLVNLFRFLYTPVHSFPIELNEFN